MSTAHGPAVACWSAAFKPNASTGRPSGAGVNWTRTTELAVALAGFTALREPTTRRSRCRSPAISPWRANGLWSSMPRARRLVWRRGSSPPRRELPDADRRFEVLWSFEPAVVRSASEVAIDVVRGARARGGEAGRRRPVAPCRPAGPRAPLRLGAGPPDDRLPRRGAREAARARPRDRGNPDRRQDYPRRLNGRRRLLRRSTRRRPARRERPRSAAAMVQAGEAAAGGGQDQRRPRPPGAAAPPARRRSASERRPGRAGRAPRRRKGTGVR